VKILVPVKRVCDPDNANKVKVSDDSKAVTSDGLEWKPNPFDEYAVEAALRLVENAATNERNGEVIVVSIGPSDVQQTLRQTLAMGADRGILVQAEDKELDSLVVARALKALVDKEKPDLVLMPIGGHFVMSPKDAAIAVNRYLKPKFVIPMHYGTFPILEPNADRFVAELAKVSPVTRPIVLAPGEETTI